MFTGIVFNLGTVSQLLPKGKNYCLSIRFEKTEKNIQTGESIAVNGVCLTVAEKTTKGFKADLAVETLEATTLGGVRKGQKVHLERALLYGGRVGGHFVTGHVDTRVKIVDLQSLGRQRVLWLKTPRKFSSFITPKGAVTLDGVSLTVQEVSGSFFKVALIPHTLEKTTFGSLSIGDELNMEVDMLARYARKNEESKKRLLKTRVWIQKLKQQGF